MAGNSFIKFAEVPIGESLTKSHPGKDGWLEIADWGWEVTADTSFTKGSGSAVGKPQAGTFNFKHFFDLSSCAIMQRIVSGTHFSTVTVDMLKQTGAGAPQVYLRIVMSSVFITKAAIDGSEDGSMNQAVDMVFKEIFIGYQQQGNDGKLSGTTLPFNWSIPNMKLETPAITTAMTGFPKV